MEKLIPLLREKGYKVCYLKHDPKGHGITDKEGSDTHRISRVCEKVGLLSPERFTLWDSERKELKAVLREYFSDCDIVILEGFKGYDELPKIAVGEVETRNVLLRVDKETELEDIIRVIESVEDLL